MAVKCQEKKQQQKHPVTGGGGGGGGILPNSINLLLNLASCPAKMDSFEVATRLNSRLIFSLVAGHDEARNILQQPTTHFQGAGRACSLLIHFYTTR